MTKITSYKELIVWQKSMELAKVIYALTSKLPKNEVYGIVSQMQRSAVSIPSNIAEGHKRGTRKDYSQFLRMALGSAAELETQIILVQDIYKPIEVKESINLVIEVQKILTVIIKKLQSA